MEEEKARFLAHQNAVVTELERYAKEDKDDTLERALDEFVSTQLQSEELKAVRVLEWLKGIDMEMVEKMQWTGSPSPLVISNRRF